MHSVHVVDLDAHIRLDGCCGIRALRVICAVELDGDASVIIQP
jgi:hypothetical protein